jgi:hypothetical protein
MKEELLDLCLKLAAHGEKIFIAILVEVMIFLKMIKSESLAMLNGAFASFKKTNGSGASISKEEKEEKEYWWYQAHGDPMHIYQDDDKDR